MNTTINSDHKSGYVKPQAASSPCTTFRMSRAISRRTIRRRTNATSTFTAKSCNLTAMFATIAAVSTLIIGWTIPVSQPFIWTNAFMIVEHPQQHWSATKNVDRQRPQHGMTSTLQRHNTIKLYSNVAIKPQSIDVVSDNNDDDADNVNVVDDDIAPQSTWMTSEEVKLRTEKQLERLKLKDRLSPKLSKEVRQ